MFSFGGAHTHPEVAEQWFEPLSPATKTCRCCRNLHASTSWLRALIWCVCAFVSMGTRYGHGFRLFVLSTLASLGSSSLSAASRAQVSGVSGCSGQTGSLSMTYLFL